MNKNSVPESKTINWKLDGDNAVVLNGNVEFLLNKSATIVWELINGINTIQDVINKMLEMCGDENSEEYITEIVESSIDQFLENGLILIQPDDAEGWFQYE